MTGPGYCSQCGAELSPGFRFCPGCGAATSGTAALRVPAAAIDTASDAAPKPPSPQSERALKDFEAQFDALKKRVSTKKSHSILTDPELAESMRRKAKERAAQRTWARCCTVVEEAIRPLLN